MSQNSLFIKKNDSRYRYATSFHVEVLIVMPKIFITGRVYKNKVKTNETTQKFKKLNKLK